MKCNFCNADVKEWDRKTMSHLIVTKDAEDGATHTHGPIESPGVINELISAVKEVVVLPTGSSIFPKKEIIFHNRQRIGDIFMFTCAVRDFKKAYPDVKVGTMSTAMHIWDNNPYVDRTLKPFYAEGKTLENVTPADFLNGSTNVLKIGPGGLTNSSNRIDWHFANAYRMSIEKALNIHIEQGESRGDIWMTREEYDAPRLFKDPYWLIVVSGEKGWGCKMYPFEKWQEFINQNPDVNFVQLGTNGDNPPRLQGTNVVDYVGKTEDKQTGIRDLYKLFLNAEGSISLVSFAMHLSGALYKPALVVAGAREPVSFTQYHGHRYLANDGCHPCSINACWHCDIKSCPHVNAKNEPLCVEMIAPEDLTKALNQYYIGGRLKKGVVSDKPKQFKNIVATPVKVVVTPVKVVVPEVAKPEAKKTEDKKAEVPILKPIIPKRPVILDGAQIPLDVMSWGSTSIFEEDWQFIQQVIDDYSVKSVLEFGAGLSTIILNELKLKVVTFENNKEWMESTKKLNHKSDIRLWDGKELDLKEIDTKFDLAFVDGPRAYGAKIFGRQRSIEVASQIADIVIVHDATRPGELLWQDTYLKDKFDFVAKGGKWEYAHLWVKKGYIKAKAEKKAPIEAIKDAVLPIPEDQGKENSEVIGQCTLKPDNVAPKSKKHIKLVSTARGWGGCARSVCTIMKFLLREGHTVEFIPFRNSVSSSEFKTYIKDNLQGLIISEGYNTLKEACDVLFVYADDFVWDFGLPPIVDAFSGINADKKVMMLNYRMGNVGKLEWTKGWDKYMFLNSIQERELLKVLPGVKTKVLPPCTELEEFLKIQPNYNTNLRLVRISSQGNTKFEHKDDIKDDTQQPFFQEVDKVLSTRDDVTISMLPGPSFIPNAYRDRFYKVGRTSEARKVAEFLGTGNLFWYSLPIGYPDQGPRVVLEAMAAGLPILADNWGGVVDRVTEETGWLCETKEEHRLVVKEMTTELLEAKGMAAKQRANDEFKPEAWIKEILD